MPSSLILASAPMRVSSWGRSATAWLRLLGVRRHGGTGCRVGGSCEEENGARIRGAPGGPAEILMIQRHSKSKFAAGDYVFAGGKVEADDIPDDVERFVRGLSPEEASVRLGGDLAPRKALGYWVGAIREAFEEVGMLLAYDRHGELVRFTPENRARFEAYRTACQSANPAFFTMLRAEDLTLATDRLTYVAHWITPEEQPLRFDTRFFGAVAPPQDPVVDGHEIVALRWLTPP